MSRILKAPYITIDEENFIAINNQFNISKNDTEQNKIFENQQENLDFYEEKNLTDTSKNEILDIKQQVLETAREQAEQIIQNAKNEAEQLLLNAKTKAEENANKIYEENKQMGFDEGFKKGEDEANLIKNEAEQLLLNTKNEIEETKKYLEPELINLVINISQKILTKSFEINPEIVALLIKKGLEQVKTISNIKIYISENQYETVIENKNEIIGIDMEKNNIEILKDNSLEDNDCFIETEFGSIKCGLNEQFNGIKEALTYLLA